MENPELILANKTPRSDPHLLHLSSRDYVPSHLLSFCARSLSTHVCGTRTIVGVCTVGWTLRRFLWVSGETLPTGQHPYGGVNYERARRTEPTIRCTGERFEV